LIYLNAEPSPNRLYSLFSPVAQIRKAISLAWYEINMNWKPIDTAPFGPDVELAIIDGDGTHAFAFPCRRFVGGWMNVKTKKELSVLPTPWRLWTP
jgi:hypothetical protein